MDKKWRVVRPMEKTSGSRESFLKRNVKPPEEPTKWEKLYMTVSYIYTYKTYTSTLYIYIISHMLHVTEYES